MTEWFEVLEPHVGFAEPMLADTPAARGVNPLAEAVRTLSEMRAWESEADDYKVQDRLAPQTINDLLDRETQRERMQQGYQSTTVPKNERISSTSGRGARLPGETSLAQMVGVETPGAEYPKSSPSDRPAPPLGRRVFGKAMAGLIEGGVDTARADYERLKAIEEGGAIYPEDVFHMVAPGYTIGAGRAAGKTAGELAGEVGVFGSKPTRPSSWTQEMVDKLAELNEKYGRDSRRIVAEFLKAFPGYAGKPATVQRMNARTKAWGGTSEQTGAKTTKIGNGETELGAFGGARTGQRVTPEMIEEIVQELGLESEIQKSKRGTTYVIVRDPQTKTVTKVRIPSETDPHGGKAHPWFIDTSQVGTKRPSPAAHDLAGDPFEGNPAAIRSRLQYWYGRQPALVGDVPGEEVWHQDPRQLKLLSPGAAVPMPNWEDVLER